MRIKHLFILLAFAAGVVSCASPRKVTVSEPVSIALRSTSAMDITCRVTNCSAHKITLENARFVLNYRGAGFCTIILSQAVTVPKCSQTDIQFSLRFRITADPFTLLTLRGVRSSDLTLSGEAKVRSGMARKKIKVEDKPLSEILTNFEFVGLDIPALLGI